MTNATLIHTVHCGLVKTQVCRSPGRCRDTYTVVIQGIGTSEELAQAQSQAEMYVPYEEQLARMAWCPSCGG